MSSLHNLGDRTSAYGWHREGCGRGQDEGLEAVVLNSRLAEHHEIGLLPNNRLSGYPGRSGTPFTSPRRAEHSVGQRWRPAR
eukprot:scaffold123817_cov51-Phaeocystis_antarctica.AAC.1